MTLEEQLQERLDVIMEQYLTYDSLSRDDKLSFDGEMRGLGFALGVIRGTSSMVEVLAADKRVGVQP